MLDNIIHANKSFRILNVKDALKLALTEDALKSVIQIHDDLGWNALVKVVNAVKAIEPDCEFVVRGELLVAGSSRYKCPSLKQD